MVTNVISKIVPKRDAGTGVAGEKANNPETNTPHFFSRIYTL